MILAESSFKTSLKSYLDTIDRSSLAWRRNDNHYHNNANGRAEMKHPTRGLPTIKLNGPRKTKQTEKRKQNLEFQHHYKTFTPFQVNVPYLYPSKTSENQRLSDVFRGYIGLK